MKIAFSLPRTPEAGSLLILTIGNFDGVHLGHKAVLSRVKEVAKENKASTAVLTFSNHPSSVLSPNTPVPLLCSLGHKIHLIEKENIDYLFLLPFTREFSELTVDTFLSNVKHSIPFTTLILGSDATLGKNKEGDRERVKLISKSLRFGVEYLPDTSIDGERISSSKIRDLVQQGKLQQAAKFLGRKFSIYGSVIRGTGRGAKIGFPTANIDIKDLCLPPLGVYAVTMTHNGQHYFGVANLGIAPTLRIDSKPVFEVHLFNHTLNLYGESVEVTFDEYIRPEQRFDGIDQLKLQISKDIRSATEINRLAHLPSSN